MPYDPEWPRHFEDHVRKLRDILGRNSVEFAHIGSTSVPDLSAKPIIDILCLVNSLSDIISGSAELKRKGYNLKGEYGIEGRFYFTRASFGPNPAVHVHGFQHGATLALDHLKFRNRLRASPRLAKAYDALKYEICGPGGWVTHDYQQRKNHFIKTVLADCP